MEINGTGDEHVGLSSLIIEQVPDASIIDRESVDIFLASLFNGSSFYFMKSCMRAVAGAVVWQWGVGTATRWRTLGVRGKR